jgi:hypothetical protein
MSERDKPDRTSGVLVRLASGAGPEVHDGVRDALLAITGVIRVAHLGGGRRGDYLVVFDRPHRTGEGEWGSRIKRAAGLLRGVATVEWVPGESGIDGAYGLREELSRGLRDLSEEFEKFKAPEALTGAFLEEVRIRTLVAEKVRKASFEFPWERDGKKESAG